MTSIYLHIPFCRSRCTYCDFNTYASQETLIPAYVDALCREIEIVGDQVSKSPNKKTAETIFIGGGTPSLLAPSLFEKILNSIRDSFEVSFDAEVTLEANPGTLTPNTLQELCAQGFNRISLGVQSIHIDELRLLGRIHDANDVLDSVNWARQSRFENLNLDLIFGLPDQPNDHWRDTVRQIVSLQPEHISLYALTIEPRTPLGHRVAQGLLPIPDPDLAADMYEWAGEYLEGQGYIQYEISNWAKDVSRIKCQVTGAKDQILGMCQTPSYACQHNLQTWRNQPYLGFGAGAHGYEAGMRYSNVLRIKTYLERMASSKWQKAGKGMQLMGDGMQREIGEFPLSPASSNHHRVFRGDEMKETMMLGLRLTREGVSANDFTKRFQVQLRDVFGKEIEELLGLGLVECVGKETSEVFTPIEDFTQTSEVIRLTKRGRLLGNQAFMRFI